MSGSFSTNLGLPALPETDDAGRFVDLLPIHNAIRNLAANLDVGTGRTLVKPEDYENVSPYVNIASYIIYVRFSEAVEAGHLIRFTASGTELRGSKAFGPTSANFARGFSMSKQPANAIGPVGLFGLNPYISGLTPGAPYYLSGTAGLLSPTSGYHFVGFAVSPNHLWFNPSYPAS
jgi:hypothetical protein